MKYIKLSGERGKGKRALVDNENFDCLSKFRWHVMSKGYARCTLFDGGREYTAFMHNMVLPPQDGQIVVFKGANKLDCRKSNLHYTTRTLKAWNSRLPKNNTSGYKGVHQQGNKWVAMIEAAKQRLYLGLYDTAEQAAMACEEARAAFDKGYIKTI